MTSPASAGQRTRAAPPRPRARRGPSGRRRRAASRAPRGACRRPPRRSRRRAGASSSAVQIWSDGVAVEPPEVPAVLVPRQVRAAAGVLVHEERAVERDARAPLVHARGDALEDVVRDPRPEERVLLELLDLAVLERRALPALARRRDPRSAPSSVSCWKKSPSYVTSPSMIASARARSACERRLVGELARAAPSRARGSERRPRRVAVRSLIARSTCRSRATSDRARRRGRGPRATSLERRRETPSSSCFTDAGPEQDAVDAGRAREPRVRELDQAHASRRARGRRAPRRDRTSRR